MSAVKELKRGERSYWKWSPAKSRQEVEDDQVS
jgi:hypothetical protein